MPRLWVSQSHAIYEYQSLVESTAPQIDVRLCATDAPLSNINATHVAQKFGNVAGGSVLDLILGNDFNASTNVRNGQLKAVFFDNDVVE